MRNTQASSCYGHVGNQSHHDVPALLSPAQPTSLISRTAAEDDDSRSMRLFGRSGVLLSTCGGPCAKLDVIAMAFGESVVAL